MCKLCQQDRKKNIVQLCVVGYVSTQPLNHRQGVTQGQFLCETNPLAFISLLVIK